MAKSEYRFGEGPIIPSALDIFAGIVSVPYEIVGAVSRMYSKVRSSISREKISTTLETIGDEILDRD